MKKIANIVADVELVNHNKVDYINYVNYPFIPNGLPTLFVGWGDLKKQQNNYRLNILEKEIEKNHLYWEFSFDEKKSEHINGISMFINNVPYYYVSGYTYQLIDPVFNQITNINELLNIINQYKIIYSYVYKDEMIYLLTSNNIVIGLDIKMFNYFDIENVHHSLPNTMTMYDPEGQIYKSHLDIFPQFQNLLKRNIVVLLSKSVIL